MGARSLRTVTGDIPVESLGLILPHEHLFVDLRGPLAPGYGVADPVAVEHVLRPYLADAHEKGVTALVDCGTIGVGRNIEVLRHLAAMTPIHIVVPTGVYREGFIPPNFEGLSAEQLAELWVQELTVGIESTDTRAGFIKIAMSDNGPTDQEVRNLEAAALVSNQTGAVIASHTIGGTVAQREVAILDSVGHDPSRFIWVHAHTEPDVNVHIALARRGINLEFDAIGADNWHPYSALLDSVLALLEAGFADQILLSHDAGWYDPAQPDGLPRPDGFRGYTALIDRFIPDLKARGVSDEMIHLMTVTNPAGAFALNALKSGV